MSTKAPLYTATYDLAAWLLGHLGKRADYLSRNTCDRCLRLLDCMVLALKDRDRWEHLEEADEILIGLRQRIRLAHDDGLLDERQAWHALGMADNIGRQIGGWQRHLMESQ
jgi:hypothetical protein